MARRTKRPIQLLPPLDFLVHADPAAPTKNELIQAQQDGEFAGRVAADGVSGWGLEVNEGDVEGGRTRTMCDIIVETARKDAESGIYRMQGTPRVPSFAPLQSAYWAGFDWSVKQKFACVCRGGDDDEGLDGLRRRGRRGKRK